MKTLSIIESAYRARGFRPQVMPASSVQEPENPADPDRRVSVTIAIVEGPRTLVRAVTFEGNKSLAVSDLRMVMTMAPGRPYSAVDVLADRDRIEQAYRDRGYESVVVTPQPVFAEGDTRADVRFEISEGPQVIVDHIIIVGNRRISIETIEQELVLKPGQPLGDAAVVQSRSNLVALGLFRRIQIDPVAHSGEPRRDVVVRVEESPPRTIDLLGGVEGGYLLRTGENGVAEERFELAPRGSFQIGRRNLWGKNRSVTLFTRVSLRSRDSLTPDVTAAPTDQPFQASYGFHEYRVVGTYREPRVFGTPGEVLLTGILEQAIRSSFNFSRREVRAQGGMRVAQIYNLSGLYSFQKIKLFDEKITNPVDRPLIDRLFPEVRLSKLSSTIIRDTADPAEALDPSHGTRLIASADLAMRAIGSEVGFAKTYLQGFFYRRLPVPRRTVLALGARVGAAHGFPRQVGGDVVQDLPASERFFAGGETSVRGFSLDRLGNRLTITDTGYPKGGNGVVVLNSELRFNVLRAVQAVGFIDAGNVFPRASDLSLTDLRPAAGFGVLYTSPLGPIRVDLGFNLRPRELVPGTPERGRVWHFLLGQAF